MASGRPVLAFNAGGARETVSSPAVGLRFAEQTAQSLIQAIDTFEQVEDQLDPAVIRDHAMTFAATHFRERMMDLIEQKLMLNNGFREEKRVSASRHQAVSVSDLSQVALASAKT
jgi:glycosyltransferase involved in cell wall biosynthesis